MRRGQVLVWIAVLAFSGAAFAEVLPTGKSKPLFADQSFPVSPQGRILTLPTGKTFQSIRGFDIREEVGIGQGVALNAFAQIGPLVQDDALLRYVNLVGHTCAQTCDRPALPYRFAVIKNDDMVNAFAGPGGYVFVTTGTLKLMKSEAELAGVLSHEIGHVVKKHSLANARVGKLAEAAIDLGAESEKDREQFMKLTDMMVTVLLDTGLSKPAEFEADHLGTEFAYNAGYDPRGLRDFLVTLKQQQGGRTTGWFKTHPDLGERIAKIDQQIAADMAGAEGYAVLGGRFRTHCLSRLK